MSSSPPTRQTPSVADLEPLFGTEVIQTGVAKLGQRITAELGAEDPILVALLGGSVIFLADLVRAIGKPIRYEFIHVGAEEESGVMQIQYPIPLDIAGQSVLVIKDVVASGVTEPYLEQQLRALPEPTEVLRQRRPRIWQARMLLDRQHHETERDDVLWRNTARLYGLTVTATA